MHFEKEINLPLYPGVFVIILSDETEKVNKLFPKFKSDILYAHTMYTEWKGKKGFIVLLNMWNEEEIVTPGTIAHEALHATNFICDSVGILEDYNNDEAQAYLLGWLVDKIDEFIKRKVVQE